MGSSLLNLSGRRLLLAAQGSLQLRSCGTHLYCRNRPTVEVQTSWHQARMQHGVRSATNILEDKKDEGFRKKNSGERVDVGKSLTNYDQLQNWKAFYQVLSGNIQTAPQRSNSPRTLPHSKKSIFQIYHHFPLDQPSTYLLKMSQRISNH
jgi:hypothetical protein